MSDKYKIPRINSEYINVYRPTGNTYKGPEGNELHTGKWYDAWVPNDHTFIQDANGKWHIFGITHPLTAAANIHEGEVQLFHAEAPEDVFRGKIQASAFKDKGTILAPGERPGETIEIHSPFIVRKDGVFHMIYGPTQFRLATSGDLQSWTLRGELFHDAEGASRDPQIMFHDGRYYLCYCSGNEVRLRESADLLDWGSSRTILVMPEGIFPESPFLMCLNHVFYLFVCTWDGDWDNNTVAQAYQHKTLVFAAGGINDFVGKQAVTIIAAHAPEIIQHDGQYFISSAEWPVRGVNVATLIFI